MTVFVCVFNEYLDIYTSAWPAFHREKDCKMTEDSISEQQQQQHFLHDSKDIENI